MSNPAIALALTGASGAAYGLRLLEVLLAAGNTVYLMVSPPGRMVLQMEADIALPSRSGEIRDILGERFGAAPDQLQVFGNEDWMAPLASGSNVPRAMVVCPCTSATLANIASGASRSLIERAADVVLKERRQLLLVVREMPFSVIHLENMLKLARLGVTIMPPCPGFYHRPQTVAELVDFVVARVLDHLDIEQQLVPRWGTARDGQPT